MKAYIGIDPGKSGGLAVVIEGATPYTFPMPETDGELWATICDISKMCDGNVIAAIELVHSSPQMGVKSAFTFGQGFGSLRMALTAARLSWREVRPQVWMKEMGCMTKGDKNVSLQRAQALFPVAEWPKTKTARLAIADALLIAEWLRRQR